MSLPVGDLRAAPGLATVTCRCRPFSCWDLLSLEACEPWHGVSADPASWPKQRSKKKRRTLHYMAISDDGQETKYECHKCMDMMRKRDDLEGENNHVIA